LTCSIFIIN